jgi:thiamine biosynthesis lipoprotein
MNRRDFLDPRRLASSAGQVLGALEELHELPATTLPEEYSLLRVARRAMATTFEVVVPYGTPDGLAAANAALDAIDRLEDQLTVYRDSSEVARLNRLAPYGPVVVEAGLYGLLTLAGRITEETEGAFDITAGALIKAWGFYRRRGHIPAAAERAEVMTRVGMRHVALDPDGQAVSYDRFGLEINLGSIGKGYALDRVAQLLRHDWNLPAALLHGGQSSVYAIGSEPANNRGWTVGIQHPWDRERRLAKVWLKDRALATSAATFQHLEYEGRRLGHILDPRTGWPAEGVASATALAPTAAEADALATAFFILGVEKTRAYCERHADVGAVLLPEGPSAAPVMLGRVLGELSS